MKIVIFAGGSGRRLWPISRQKSPKQFEPIIGSKSTLQLAVDRVAPTYGVENVYVSTNTRIFGHYKSTNTRIDESQFKLGTPVRLDLAAAVGLAMVHMAKGMSDEQLRDEPNRHFDGAITIWIRCRISCA